MLSKKKLIREEMTERADIGDAGPSEDEYTEDFNDETAALQSTSNGKSGQDGEFAISKGENRIPSVAVPSSTFTVTHSPRSLLRKRTTSTAKQEENTIIEALRTFMIRGQMRRNEEHLQRMMDQKEERLRREEELRFREDQRTEERERMED